jgi:hypothetical protein
MSQLVSVNAAHVPVILTERTVDSRLALLVLSVQAIDQLMGRPLAHVVGVVPVTEHELTACVL